MLLKLKMTSRFVMLSDLDTKILQYLDYYKIEQIFSSGRLKLIMFSVNRVVACSNSTTVFVTVLI